MKGTNVRCGIQLSGLSILLSPLLTAQSGLTQPISPPIVPDSTLGDQRSVIVPMDGKKLVTGGTVRGPHLFHSFESFNVDVGQSVYFAPDSGIANIFSRVTGSTVSDIQGTLGVEGGASLYLLNPNGIVFGPGAQLDISSSFVGTTAEQIDFGNGLAFSAVTPAAPPLLNVVVQPGLQYGAASGSIMNQGSLQVGRDLTLGARRLEVAGQLEAGRDIVLQGEE